MNKLNIYHANLAIWNAKIHNLHWNVTGRSFVAVHEFAERLYNEVFEQYDDVAEAVKMRGQYPIVKLADYLKYATIEEIDSKDYTDIEVIKILEQDMKIMLDIAMQARQEADDENDYKRVAMFEDYIASYEKNLWFMHAMQK